MKERRTKEGYRLRVYMDALKDTQHTTNKEWIENYMYRNPPYISKLMWISYLEKCILAEAEYFAKGKTT